MITRQAINPLLVQTATERTGDAYIPGYYCPHKHVWVIDGHPIVEARSAIAELMTKTEAQLERDDASPDLLLEMQTKTKTQQERDDEDYAHSSLELLTKTSNISERDD
jgi:hypothetical protein